MRCAWSSLLGVLPLWLRNDVDKLGRETLQELRLRTGAPPELVLSNGMQRLSRTVSREDLHFCVNTASRYSPWAAATATQGYITAPGGHRIGLCGEVACKDGAVNTFREIHSINIRIARDFPGIGKDAEITGSVLILGAPGWGKTTLLRDIARNLSETETVAVVDERGELFPDGFLRGLRMDVLTGCPKTVGIDMVLRSMGPSTIAVDEITAAADTQALLQAVGCGVRLLATAHASNIKDLGSSPVYKPLLDYGIFQTVLVLNPDKSFYTERMIR